MRSDETPRPRPGILVRAIAWTALILLYLPLLSAVVVSFIEGDRANGSIHYGFGAYQRLIENKSLLEGLVLSVEIGLLVTVISVVLGTVLALGLERVQFRGKAIFDRLMMLPLVVPELVYGLSLLVWFVALRVTLGRVSIVLAHVTFCLTYVVMTIRSRLKEYDRTIEEAAEDLGATGTQIFWKVTLPLIAPGILSAALMAFTLSFDDFLITYFTAGVGSDTLPVKIYAMIKFGINPEINALSAVLFGGTLIAVFVGQMLMARKPASNR